LPFGTNQSNQLEAIATDCFAFLQARIRKGNHKRLFETSDCIMAHPLIGVNGFNPPFPEAPTIDETAGSELSSKKNSGQRLMGLVRLLEKRACDDNHEEHLDEAVDLLNNLISLYSRRGLLQGNVKKAERIQSLQKSNTKEKRSRKGSSNNELNIQQGESNYSVDSADSVGLQEESLIFTSVIRILNGTNEDSKDRALDDDKALLIALAAELCISISQRVKTVVESDTCTLAEYELLAQSGKSILAGFVTTLRSIELDIQKHTMALTQCNPKKLDRCLTLASLDEDKHVDPIISCLKAASSLVSLFGTKLSRSTALISDLKTIAWRFLTLPHDSIQQSAAKLIACIPLAGGTERKTPSELWNVAISDIISMLSVVLDKIAPLNKSKKGNESETSDHAQNILQEWIAFVREDIFEESARVVSFHRFICGLTRCFQSLISQDGMGQHADCTLLDAKLDVENTLDVIESFLAFPLSAETILYKTKKRLRNETVDGGLLSPRALSTQVANQIKLLGHDILDCILASLGGPTLLPFARRITRISYASLLTSCSGTVRKVMDPTSAVQLDGKKRRWLHLSIPLRRVAINTFKTVTTSFGSDRSGKSSDRSNFSRSDGELAAALVVGCLIEEISSKDIQCDFDDCWGTFNERVELM
jgi:hypothetical protein